jgi:nucleoside-diphosphate-sugar epimerase
VPDVGKLNRLTGWEAQLSLEQILDDVVAEVKASSDNSSVREGSGIVES